MSNSVMPLICLLPILSLTNLVLNHAHFLMVLLSLEGLMLSLVLVVPLSLSMIAASNIALSVILLTLGACEASLGLSLMVVMSRAHGSDLLKALTSSKC